MRRALSEVSHELSANHASQLGEVLSSLVELALTRRTTNMSEKERITEEEFYTTERYSVKMADISSSISMLTEKRNLYIAGGLTISISLRSIIPSIKYRCPILHLMYAVIPIAPTWRSPV